MPDESTTSDLLERTRAIFEAMDRDWDIDALEADWAPRSTAAYRPRLGRRGGVSNVSREAATSCRR